MILGLSFCQTLRGSYWLLDSPTDERAIALTIEASTGDVRAFARDRTWHVKGTIDAERLASGQTIEGALTFRLLDERRVHYRIAFRADDGRCYELSGQGEWSGFSPIASLTVLPASLYDDRGEETGRGSLRFVRSEWARSIKSLRLRVSQ
jgi:hypothetical protein